jgi:S-adenosylhomocysteine hydrolase
MQYKVKDMTQADFGRLEIELAEAEMPGLMACRTEFGSTAIQGSSDYWISSYDHPDCCAR